MPAAAEPPPVTTPPPPAVQTHDGAQGKNARDMMRERFGSTRVEGDGDNGDSILGRTEAQIKKPEAKLEPPKPSERPGADTPPEKPADAPKPADVPHGAKPADKPKWNPNKEIKEWRIKAETAEARLKQLEGERVPAEERTTLTERMESVRKRNEELENEIRFVNYEKSREFEDKHHKPYLSTLATAMRDVSRIPVVDAATGAQRAATEDDLFELMNLDPVRQVEVAEAKFGEKLAGRVIAQADKVRDSLISRNNALTEAKELGGKRETETRERTAAQQKEFTGKIQKWAKDAVLDWDKDPDAKTLGYIQREDGKELTPDEQEHNAAIERGREHATWLDKKAADAKTPEEAAQIVRKKVAAIKKIEHWGAMRRLLARTRKELEAAKKELAQFQGTTPETGGGRKPSNGNGAESEVAFASLDRTLKKMARI